MEVIVLPLVPLIERGLYLLESLEVSMVPYFHEDLGPRYIEWSVLIELLWLELQRALRSDGPFFLGWLFSSSLPPLLGLGGRRILPSHHSFLNIGVFLSTR